MAAHSRRASAGLGVLVLCDLFLFTGLMWYLTSRRTWPVWLPVVPIYCAALVVTLWVVALWSSFARGEATTVTKVALLLMPPAGVFLWAAGRGGQHGLRGFGYAAIVAAVVAAMVIFLYGGVGTAV
jgi:hypothetical protein